MAPPARLYWLAVGVAVVVGIWLRFTGLTHPALADDEYYIVRSVENILRSGLPEYPCGGYYPRGLLFQYLSAALALAGTPIEFVPRYLAALSSLLVLPGAWLLARRTGGPALALPVLAWLSLSAWEIDGAQFGRMYAPFQAVFTWYAWFFLRAAIDDDRRARWWLAALTVVGILTWEGGVLLAATNLALPFINRKNGVSIRRDGLYLGAMALLAFAAYRFVTTDFRQLDPALVYPPDFDAVTTTLTPGWREVPAMLGPLELRQWPWIAAAAIPIIVSLIALVDIWRGLQHRRIVAAGLVVALAAATAHYFAVSGLVLALLVTLGLVRWNELRSRPFIACVAALALWLAGWIVYGLLAAGWTEGTDTTLVSRVRLLTLAYNLLAFPDFLLEIVKPWATAVPRLSIAIGFAITAAVVLAGRHPDQVAPELRVTLVLLLLLVAGAAASNPPRHETRYVFFLYPLAIVLMLAMLARLAGMVARVPVRAALAFMSAAVLFVTTEDSGMREMGDRRWLRDIPAVLMPATGGGHLIHQTDSRSPAQWLSAHAQPGRDLLVNASPGVDFYYQDFDFAYIDWTQQRFLAYACDHGRRERWGNQRLLYTTAALRRAVLSKPRTFITATREQAQQLRQGALRGLESRIVHESSDARLQVIEILGSPS